MSQVYCAQHLCPVLGRCPDGRWDGCADGPKQVCAGAVHSLDGGITIIHSQRFPEWPELQLVLHHDAVQVRHLGGGQHFVSAVGSADSTE